MEGKETICLASYPPLMKSAAGPHCPQASELCTKAHRTTELEWTSLSSINSDRRRQNLEIVNLTYLLNAVPELTTGSVGDKTGSMYPHTMLMC